MPKFGGSAAFAAIMSRQKRKAAAEKKAQAQAAAAARKAQASTGKRLLERDDEGSKKAAKGHSKESSSDEDCALVAVVTGSNKGIGLEIARGLAASPNVGRVILACRNEKLAEAAAVEIRADNDGTVVECMKLDISSADSITNFCGELDSTCPRGVDILVNNAATTFNQAGIQIQPSSDTGLESGGRSMRNRAAGKFRGGSYRGYFSILVVSCFMWSGALDSSDVLQSYPLMPLS